jgi:hypothetical protein
LIEMLGGRSERAWIGDAAEIEAERAGFGLKRGLEAWI